MALSLPSMAMKLCTAMADILAYLYKCGVTQCVSFIFSAIIQPTMP